MIALAMGLLLPGTVLGSGPVLTLCLHGTLTAAVESGGHLSSHQHGSHHDGAPQGDHYGCTWMGPCSVSITALQPSTGTLLVREAAVDEVPPHPTTLSPRLSPLAYLRPRANPPPSPFS
jgi:hypothetical protein